jgi:hypothetical protein
MLVVSQFVSIVRERNCRMKCLRMYADQQGESHFEDLDVDSLPPSIPSTSVFFRSFPAGSSGSPEPADGRLLVFILTGEVELAVSDGAVRRVGPSSVVLVEDTWGKGHSNRVVGERETVQAVVELPG